MVGDALKLHEVTKENLNLIEGFLKNAGDSLSNFRYFSSRSIEVVNNHLITVVMSIDNKMVGYGHLDKDGDTVWLGVAVSSTDKGKGIGHQIMIYLIKSGRQLKIPSIYLTVDKDNLVAIRLYKKFGFVVLSEISDRSLKMVLKISES